MAGLGRINKITGFKNKGLKVTRMSGVIDPNEMSEL